MFIKGLKREEREFEMNSFHPEFYEGEYVKVSIYTNPDDKYYPGGLERIEFFKLCKFVERTTWSDRPHVRYEGFGIDQYGNAVTRCWIRYDWTTYQQTNIDIITREEFIKGIKSKLSDDLKEFINFDKL